MKTDSPPTVLFYPAGIVHFQNLRVLQKIFPAFRFLVILEPWIQKQAPVPLSSIKKKDQVQTSRKGLPENVWEESVDLLFLSMAYPNLLRLRMIHEAAQRNIPTMAIEEVNQIALNSGTINHYFLPLDYLGVPSEIEREGFLELGIPEKNVEVTGWPFYDFSGTDTTSDLDLRKTHKIPTGKKTCLLVLGSLKENDRVSLETQKTRHHLLQLVSDGLTDEYQLLIKPHPMESGPSLEKIKKQMPDAVICDPRYPIEPLLAQSDLVVNRGNSQIVLLAMIQKIPLIVIPEGITTLFHSHLDPIIANSVTEFRRVMNVYQTGQKFDYTKILGCHLPLSREQSLDRVDKFFRRALEQRTPPGNGKEWDMSILFAFLGDRTQAQVIVKKHPHQDKAFLLKKLYDGNISAEEFAGLLEYFPNKINRWHLQALFIRKLMNDPDKNDLANSVQCLEGFDGDVNPHYFMEDIIGRIELEFKAGRNTVAQRLFHKFSDEYSIFSHHRQAFDMMRFVYKDFSRYRGLRKKLWILSNLPKSYCRQYIKGKFLSAANRIR